VIPLSEDFCIRNAESQQITTASQIKRDATSNDPQSRTPAMRASTVHS
jgi:hypothetical protein